jgi:hypothetical protein
MRRKIKLVAVVLIAAATFSCANATPQPIPEPTRSEDVEHVPDGDDSKEVRECGDPKNRYPSKPPC